MATKTNLITFLIILHWKANLFPPLFLMRQTQKLSLISQKKTEIKTALKKPKWEICMSEMTYKIKMKLATNVINKRS